MNNPVIESVFVERSKKHIPHKIDTVINPISENISYTLSFQTFRDKDKRMSNSISSIDKYSQQDYMDFYYEHRPMHMQNMVYFMFKYLQFLKENSIDLSEDSLIDAWCNDFNTTIYGLEEKGIATLVFILPFFIQQKEKYKDFVWTVIKHLQSTLEKLDTFSLVYLIGGISDSKDSEVSNAIIELFLEKNQDKELYDIGSLSNLIKYAGKLYTTDFQAKVFTEIEDIVARMYDTPSVKNSDVLINSLKTIDQSFLSIDLIKYFTELLRKALNESSSISEKLQIFSSLQGFGDRFFPEDMYETIFSEIQLSSDLKEYELILFLEATNNLSYTYLGDSYFSFLLSYIQSKDDIYVTTYMRILESLIKATDYNRAPELLENLLPYKGVIKDFDKQFSIKALFGLYYFRTTKAGAILAEEIFTQLEQHILDEQESELFIGELYKLYIYFSRPIPKNDIVKANESIWESQLEKSVEKVMQELAIEYEKNIFIDGIELDFYLPVQQINLEIDGPHHFGYKSYKDGVRDDYLRNKKDITITRFKAHEKRELITYLEGLKNK